ncbi:TPA: hypothetical protein RQN91_004987 [Klebsiella michiganensis]|nr:hypothetical protein [Klebsiella michiganensis]
MPEILTDAKRITIPESKARFIAENHAAIMPMTGQLINTLVLEGKSREEIQEALKNAACGYSAFYMAFVHD